jgi:hypothetical protein
MIQFVEQIIILVNGNRDREGGSRRLEGIYTGQVIRKMRFHGSPWKEKMVPTIAL